MVIRAIKKSHSVNNKSHSLIEGITTSIKAIKNNAIFRMPPSHSNESANAWSKKKDGIKSLTRDENEATWSF